MSSANYSIEQRQTFHHNEQQRNLAIRERDQRQREEIAQQQQEQAEARNGRLTLIGLGLAVIASFSVIPSMWIDFYGGEDTTSIAETFGISYGVSQFLLFVCTGFVMLSITGLGAYQAYRWWSARE